MTRQDIPSDMILFFRTAIQCGLLDPIDLFALGDVHGDEVWTDWRLVRRDVMEIAHSQRHADNGQKRLTMMQEANNLCEWASTIR